MCGLAGLLMADPAAPADRDRLDRALAALRHRGPDDEGVYVSGPVALGHRRLSIIDLSAAGRQPLLNEDETIALVCNGEIYNHGELRAELIAAGHRFRSASDSEVILHLYEQLGGDVAAVARRLRGMFAFAIRDEPRRRLVLARDRLGQKPLVYADEPDRFIFASEPFACRLLSAAESRPDRAALASLLALGVIPAPLTGFARTRRLAPAHVLVKEDGREPALSRYWSLPAADAGPVHAVRRLELQEELLARLRESVKLRLMSDVPLGAFLSGGIDSAATVATMAGFGPVKTFTIGFTDERWNEAPQARALAAVLGTEHHERIVEPDVAALLTAFPAHFGEPFGDSSALPAWCLSAMARESVTVALSGDGADELFGGYRRYQATALAELPGRSPAALRRLGAAFARRLPASTGPGARIDSLRRFLTGLAESDPRRRALSWSRLLEDEAIEALLGPTAPASDPLAPWLRHGEGRGSPLATHLAMDTQGYLPDDLLVKTDIASMAHGLELRAPFLDHPLVEFAARLPTELKVSGRSRKILLREALAGLLPESVLDRPKRGFGVPIADWFRGPLRELLRAKLLAADAPIAGWCRPAALTALVEAHDRSRANHAHALYTLLSLALWLEHGAAELPGFVATPD